MYNRNTPKKMVVDRLFTFEKGPILLGDGKCLVCRDVDDTLKLGKLGAIPETEQKSDIRYMYVDHAIIAFLIL